MNESIVFLTVGTTPRRNARDGAEVRAYQNLSALRRMCGDVLTIASIEQRDGWDDCGPVEFVSGYQFQPFLDLWLNRPYIRSMASIISRVMPDHRAAIFCEHWHSLAVAPNGHRLIYSCHDLESKLMPVRWLSSGKAWTARRRAYHQLLTFAERSLIRRADRVVSVSATEAQEIARRAGRPAWYVPIVADGISVSEEFKINEVVRFWFYGASGASANKLMLKHIQEDLYGLIREKLPELRLHQIGSTNKYDADRREWLARHFVVHGFVPEPNRLFQAGDVCLIPYQHDTGFRTRIPELLALGVIPAGYAISFACCPELEAGQNCIVGNDPGDLVDQLVLIAGSVSRRQSLVSGCRGTAMRLTNFSYADKRWREVLDGLCTMSS